MDLGELFERAGLPLPGEANPRAPVAGVTEDSRRVGAGWVFVARPGKRADGRRFIPDAIGAGAVAVVTDLTWNGGGGESVLRVDDPSRAGAVLAELHAGSPSSALRLIGVTGTNGKTTVASLVRQIAQLCGVRCGLIGTVEIDEGDGPRPSDFTTPPAERLSASLATMVSRGCTAAAMEASSHSLDQHRVSGLRFAAGIFTNLTGDHLDYHGDMDSYAAAKARLFELLPEDGLAVVNAQSPWTARMVRDCRARIIECVLGIDRRAGSEARAAGQASAWVVTSESRGMRVRLAGPWGEIEADTGLLGEHNAMNLLQALVVCSMTLGIGAESLTLALPSLRSPSGRLERVDGPGDDVTVLVDFAHSDDALASALRAARLATPPQGALWAVFGCGGNKDRAKRPRMGAVAAGLADRVIVTSDNPRRDDPEAIIDEVIQGVPRERRSECARDADRRAAIFAALLAADPGDVIVIAGKGHEQEQEISDGAGGTVKLPFRDQDVAREALRERRTRQSTLREEVEAT